MRRYIAYITLACATVLGVCLASASVIESMNTDVAYSQGKTLYFKASHYDEESSTGQYDDFLTDADYYGDDRIIDLIADTFKDRLDNWGLSEYTVDIEGYDTLAVTLRTTANSDSQYEDIASYLAFSGGNISIDASVKLTEKEGGDPAYASYTSWETMFDGQTAWMDYIEMGSYSVPTVIVPIVESQSNYEEFLSLIDYCKSNTKEEEVDDESGKVIQEARTVNVILWANRDVETDKYSEVGANPNVTAKVLGSYSPSNAVYYADDDDDKEYPSLQLIPSSAATEDGSFNPDYSQEAYEAAVLLCNKINASSYIDDYGVGSYYVTYTYSKVADATVENLLEYGDWNLTVAASSTLLAVIISALVFMALTFVFERMLGFAIVGSTILTTFATFATFVAFMTQFNIAALVGLAVVALLGAFGGIYYGHALRDEIYKGRTLKKAHTEAAKRAFWPTIDGGVVALIIGILIYALAGDVAAKLGVMLVLGGIFSILCNLIYTRLLGWLFCNDSTTQETYTGLLGINKEKIPDVVAEEKQTYFGPYENRDFTKKGKYIAGIFSGALLLVGIVMMSVFGGLNDGNVYNDSTYRQEETILRIEVKSTDSDSISGNASPLSSIQDLYDPEVTNPSGVFYKIYFGHEDDEALIQMASIVDEVELSTTSFEVFDEDVGTDGTAYYIFYFDVTFNTVLDVDANDYQAVVNGTVVEGYTLNEIVGLGIQNLGIADSLISDQGDGVSNWVSISFMSSVPAAGVPYLWQIALGGGIGALIALVYLCIRYRLSRGFTVTLLSTVASYIAIAFFVITRISVHPVVAIGGLACLPLVMMFGIFLCAKEKEIYKESREKDKNNLAFRSDCLTKANSRAAGPIFELALMGGYTAIIFLGLGPSTYASIYLCFILAGLFGLGLTLCCATPLSIACATLLSKIKIKLPKKKKKKAQIGQLGKKNSSEPEEAVFIGIND